MSESLTPFEGENLASYEALKTAIRLADGFTLIFAVTNTEAGAQEVMRRLWRDGVRYQKAWLRDPERPLVDQVAESVRTKQPVMVLGLEGLTTVGEQMGRSLRNLNWTRPQWTARLPQTIVFWVTADMEADLAREAPDLWRFRSLRVEFAFGLLPRQLRTVEIRRRLRTLDLSPQIRLASLVELFKLSQSQARLSEAFRFFIENLNLLWQHEFEELDQLVLLLDNVDDSLLERLVSFPSARSLIMMFTKSTDAGLASFLSKSEFNQLQGVLFSDVQLESKALCALAQLPRLAGLRMLTDWRYKKKLEFVPEFPMLTHLYVSGWIVTESGLEGICRTTSLNVLDIEFGLAHRVNTEDLLKLVNLTSLRIHGHRTTSTILNTISEMRNLVLLDLSGTSVSNHRIELLADLPLIQSINLAGSKVTWEEGSRLYDRFEAQGRKVDVKLHYDD